MQVTFLGGADEIGASCAVLDVDSSFRLLVDCGQRLNAEVGQELPDFSILEQGPPVRAVLLTHAHADHIGSLPALESCLPAGCRIYGTEATLELARLMLHDTVRISARHRQGDGQLPLFPPAALHATLARFTPVRLGKPVRLDDDVRATWFPAGHLLGAALIEIKSKSGSVVFSGDVAISDQATVPGAFIPAIHPDLLVLESTYGNRLHAHRPTQERKMLERVQACIEQGGHVLFPTFALGRAQDVLALLGLAMRRGDVPPFSVYADGLVRQICKVYSRFAGELASASRRVWEQGFDPLFPEDLPILPVRDNFHRETIARGEPCVVVASSGMLQGGASQFYATQWVQDPRNLILITGYQDEESPGEALLNLAGRPAGEPGHFKLGGVRTEVHCQVEKFSLSAHADNVQLAALAEKLQPRLTLLVHGDADARETLARGLAMSSGLRVELPINGETYSVKTRSVRRTPASAAVPRINPLALWPPWDPIAPRPLDLVSIHAWLVSLTPKLAWITVDELAELWKSPEPVNNGDLTAVREALARQAQPWFVPDARRPSLLRLTPVENLSATGLPAMRLPVEQATRQLQEIFPAESGLRRFGFYPDEGLVRLEFRFPRAVSRAEDFRSLEFTRRSGWGVVVDEQTHDAELRALAQELLAGQEEIELEICHRSNRLTARQEGEDPAFDAERATAFFRRQTGYELLLIGAAAPFDEQDEDGLPEMPAERVPRAHEFGAGVLDQAEDFR